MLYMYDSKFKYLTTTTTTTTTTSANEVDDEIMRRIRVLSGNACCYSDK
jgi:hypothetical protein